MPADEPRAEVHTSPPTTRLRRDVRAGAVLLVLLAAAATLRLLFIGADSLFYDEAWHMELSTGRGSLHLRLPTNELISAPNCLTLRGAPPWYAIWNHMDWVIHPPLYHTLLRFWRATAGESGVTARVFSVVWSVLAIALFYDVVRRLHGIAPALWAAALMTLSATQVAIAQEARGYTLLVALGVAALWFMARIARDGGATPGRCAGLGLTTLAMMLTHYFAAGVCLGLAVFATIALRGRTRLATIASLLVAAAVFVIAWGPTLRAQMAYVESSADLFLKDAPGQNAVVNALQRLAVLPARLVFAPADRVHPAWFLVWAAILPVRMRQDRERQAILLWLCWLFGGVGLVAALDIARSTHHLSFIRYTVVASPAVCALLAGGWPGLAAWRRHLLPACACVVAAITLRGGYVRDNADLRPPAAYLTEALARDPRAPLLIVSPNPLGRDGQTFYLGMCAYADIFPRPAVILTQRPDEKLLQDIGPGSLAVLAAPYVDVPAERIVPGCETLDSRRFEMGWTCYRIRLPRGAIR